MCVIVIVSSCGCSVRLVVVVLFVFFFKQKTAYDMRISDWSSDVCSSDLGYLIDTSELFRVFPPKQPETVEEARLDTPVGNRETLMETGGLLREVEQIGRAHV